MRSRTRAGGSRNARCEEQKKGVIGVERRALWCQLLCMRGRSTGGGEARGVHTTCPGPVVGWRGPLQGPSLVKSRGPVIKQL